MTVLERLRQRRQALRDTISQLLEADLPEERSAAEAANAEIEARQGELTTLEARIAQLEADEQRRQAEGQVRQDSGITGDVARTGGATITSEPQIYGRGSGNSYFWDMMRLEGLSDPDARGRLQRHAQELQVELPAREARREARRREQEGRVATRDRNGFEPVYRTNPNRTDGQGGYFVPPLWLIDEFIPYLRAGRTTADLCMGLELPTGTDSINLPKITQGALTGSQVDNGAVPSRDITDTSISAPVRTIAGQEDVALQLLEQSSPAAGFDEIVFKDLIGDYNQQVDLQVIAGTGTSGQLKGITVMSGSNAITYTDGTPTVPELYLPLAQGLSQVARQRLRPATAFVMNTVRAYWMLSALDGNSRPLVTPVGGSGQAFNQLGSATLGSEGLLANVIGTNVYGDPNVPTNLGTGTNQDEIIAGRFDDAYLWEGMLRTRTLMEVLSGTLQVRLQLYNYVAFMPDRYPMSFSVIGGTGLVAPSGF